MHFSLAESAQSGVCGDARLPIPPQRLVDVRPFFSLFFRKARFEGDVSSSQKIFFQNIFCDDFLVLLLRGHNIPTPLPPSPRRGQENTSPKEGRRALPRRGHSLHLKRVGPRDGQTNTGERMGAQKGIAEAMPFTWRRHPDLNRGIRVLQTLALPLGYGAEKKQCGAVFGAGNETRTRDIHLGKVTLYH